MDNECLRVPSAAANVALFVAMAALAGAGSKIDDGLELERQGKLERASDLLADAAREYRAAGDSRNLARALGIAADIAVSLGRYDAAIRDATEALKLRGALNDRVRIGDDYNTIGLSYQYLGNYPASLEAYQKALDSDRSAGDSEGEITRLNNIGNIYYFQGRYSDALQYYEEARQKLPAGSGTSWSVAKRKLTFANLAVLFQRLGQEQRALELYRQLTDTGAASGNDMPATERAQLLLNQGVLYRRLGDPVKALELYRGAQALFQAERHADGEIGALRNIGIVLAMDLNEAAGARESFTRALALASQSGNRRGVVQARLYRGELFDREGRGREAEDDLQAALTGAQQAGLAEEQWKSLHALGRIAEEKGTTADAERDFREAIRIIESVRGSLSRVALRTDFLADKRDVYDSLIELRLRDSAATPAEIFSLMERSRARTLLDRTRGRVAMSEPQEDRIQQQLLPGTVLVEYWIGPRSAAALWMTHTGSGLVRHDDAANWGTDPAQGASILREIPLAERLIVVPDGALSAVPFEALRTPGAQAQLIERCEVSYLPAASFLRPPTPGRWRAPWAIEVIALADPLVSSDPFDEHWTPLPGSADEARAIARIVDGRAAIHLGADMRKRYLSAIAPDGVPLLHLTTHATIDATNPDRSRILFANEYLLQQEVYDLKLAGVELVTLSACDTARGAVVRGEGVQAFSQAFLAAGAASVVTTLWRVADGPTADFMKQFYYGLARGESKGAALRQAKLRFLRSGTSLADSRYWAAFVLTGDAEAAIPRAVPVSWCLMAAAVLLVLCAVAGWVTRAVSTARRSPQKV